MPGPRTFRTLTSSQQSGIKSRHINTHITAIPNTQYTWESPNWNTKRRAACELWTRIRMSFRGNMFVGDVVCPLQAPLWTHHWYRWSTERLLWLEETSFRIVGWRLKYLTLQGMYIFVLYIPVNRLRHNVNLLTPNVNYSGRTATLTYKVAFYIFIQQI